MGLEQSRQEKLPENIDELYEEKKQLWNPEDVSKNSVNQSTKGESTISKEVLEDASSFLLMYLKNNNVHNPKIIEPYAGNGVASNIFNKTIKKEFPEIIHKCTDILDHTSTTEYELSYPVEFGLNSVETIQKYGHESNILMMISPPPSGKIPEFSDYFCLKKWTELKNSVLFVFVGELSASDGSDGMYHHLLNHDIWKLDARKLILNTLDVFGLPCEKEIFIFKK